MIRCSCQGLHGCVPTALSATSSLPATSRSCRLRSAIVATTSPKDSQRPVRTSTSEAISSPTRWSSRLVPAAAAWKSSKRSTRPWWAGSRIANSSSTATVKSSPPSNPSRAKAICSSGLSFWASPTRRKYQSRNRLPAPAFDRDRTGSGGELSPLLTRQREERPQLSSQIAGVSGTKAGEVSVRRRIRGLQALGDLGQTGLARDERRAPAGGGLGGDHPERLREDGRRHADVRERPEVAEMAVLERAREEHSAFRRALELLARRTEADDDRSSFDPAKRLEQQVHPLFLTELADVQDGRRVVREELCEALVVAGVGIALRPGKAVPAGLFDQRGERFLARCGSKLLDVHSWWDDAHAVAPADDLLEHRPDVLRAGEHLGRLLQLFASPGAQLVVSPHGELELGSVRLDGEGHPDRCPHGRSQEHMVGEEEARREMLPHRRRVLIDEALPFPRRQVGQPACFHVLVAVEDEDGQRPLDSRPDGLGPAEVEAFRMWILAEDDDVMAELTPGLREGAGIDVRPRSAQEVAVPEENLHPWKILTHRSSPGRAEATAGRSSSSSSGTSTGSSRSPPALSARWTRPPMQSRRPSSEPGSDCPASAAGRSSPRGSTASRSMPPTISG